MRLLTGLAIVVVVVVIGGGIVASTAGQHGEQLAVDGFQRRRFSYYEAFGVRLSPTDYFTSTGNLEQTLVQKKWITDSGTPPKDDEWITYRHSTSQQVYTNDAQLLVSYLEMSGHGGPIDLLAWSTDYPGHASVMWPEVQKAAEGNLYILVPDIIHHMLDLTTQGKSEPLPEKLSADEEKAHTAAQAQQARDSLQPFLEQLYLDTGKASQSGGDTARARFAFEQVLRFDPNEAEAQAALAALPPAPPAEKEADEPEATEDSSEAETPK